MFSFTSFYVDGLTFDRTFQIAFPTIKYRVFYLISLATTGNADSDNLGTPEHTCVLRRCVLKNLFLMDKNFRPGEKSRTGKMGGKFRNLTVIAGI